MASPYISEIRMFAGNFAPGGWEPCEGQSLAVATHGTLHGAIGTTFGGDGKTSFRLPDLRGRVPIHRSAKHPVGEKVGVENVTLSIQQIPSHSHMLQGSNAAAASSSPTANVPASLPVQVNRTAYGTDPPPTTLDPSSIAAAGGGKPHTNVAPYGCISFIIATSGVVPPGGTADLGQLVGEIRVFPYGFTPSGWAPCEGQVVPVSQNTGLFAILGTLYGGDGKSTFGLPDLRGAAPLGAGAGTGLSDYSIGDTGGVAGVALTTAQMPAHAHALSASEQASVERQPGGQMLAAGVGVAFYDDKAAPVTNLASEALKTAGASIEHNNRQPFMALRYCIAMQGTFPST
jgi:microcystin-dependent protein